MSRDFFRLTRRGHSQTLDLAGLPPRCTARPRTMKAGGRSRHKPGNSDISANIGPCAPTLPPQPPGSREAYNAQTTRVNEKCRQQPGSFRRTGSDPGRASAMPASSGNRGDDLVAACLLPVSDRPAPAGRAPGGDRRCRARARGAPECGGSRPDPRWSPAESSARHTSGKRSRRYHMPTA